MIAYYNTITSIHPKIIVIIGPTSSGKSELAVRIAKKFSGEVVSADSRQVYKGLDIGSGKITKKEMQGIPHHLLDVASLKSVFTALKYQKLAKSAVRKIIQNKKLPIICGGTGFYIDAFLYDWKLPEIPAQRKLRNGLDKKPKEELFSMLASLDPQRAKNIDRHNKVRLVRALEIVMISGAPVPLFKSGKNSQYSFVKIGIKIEPDKLKSRIKKRLLKRLRVGLVKEVENLHRSGLSWKRLDDFGLEYRYVSRYIRRMINYKEMVETVERESFRYAKRQMTWFKRDKNTIWVDPPTDEAGSLKSAFSTVRDFLSP
ncbi:MAG: tRNA (adenosine(37)-N6)-dimethylallyltransferase MiaA [Candidatus Colwellbacteria bacterium]|nr:tRNA (adenosine(37)-N6)-dimethylallyltransferase MiaA [Candidatus Colwellbacteria bacterium]